MTSFSVQPPFGTSLLTSPTLVWRREDIAVALGVRLNASRRSLPLWAGEGRSSIADKPCGRAA